MIKYFIFFAAAACTAATFTSVQTGNWNVSTTWGNSGAAVCHTTIPCMTDGGSAGDLVLLGNLTHTVTCPVSVACSAGSSPTSDTGAVAIGAASYSANASLVVNGTLTVAGPVRMPAATWTNNGTIIIDASWSGAPGTAAYSWVTNDVGNASQGGVFQNNGIVLGAGNSQGIGGCDANVCRSGTFGLDDAGTLGYNDQGNIDCDGGAFQFLGLAANGNLSMYSNLNAAPRTLVNCTFDTLQTIEFVESTRTAAFLWNGSRITNPLNTSSQQGTVTWLSDGTPSAPCTWENADIYGPMYYNNFSGTVTTNLNCTWTNVVHEAGPAGNLGWISTNYSTGSADQDLWYIQFPGGDASGYTLANGAQTRSVVAEYVDPGQNNGMDDMHPVSVVQGNAGNTLRNWFIEGNNFGAVSSMLEPQGGPATSQTLEIENIVQTCNQFGEALGDTVNIDGGFLSEAHISIDNITACANNSSPSIDTHAMGVGGEDVTFYAGTVPHVYSSIFYSDSNYNGTTEALCGGSNATFAAGTITTVGYNAYYFTGANSPYCTVGIANYVGTFASNTVIASGRGPNWLAGGRRLINFDQYLGYAVAAAWASGTTYTTGALASDAQSGQYGGAPFNWRFINRSGCTALASSANRPLSGTAWSQCWEPAAMAYIRAAALAGTTYSFAPTGATGLGIIGLLNAWAMRGYSPLEEGPVIANGGFAGTFIGAVEPSGQKCGYGRIGCGVVVNGATTQ